MNSTTTDAQGNRFMADGTELRAIQPWERPDSWSGKPWVGWFVGIGHNRDSGALANSNFEVFLRELRKLPEVLVDDTDNRDGWDEVDTIQIVREGHWACGWIEWVAIHPSNEAALKLADEMMCALSDYPVLDEEHWSNLEHEEVCSWWGQESLRRRVEWCREYGASIFAARCDYPPEQVVDGLREYV